MNRLGKETDSYLVISSYNILSSSLLFFNYYALIVGYHVWYQGPENKTMAGQFETCFRILEERGPLTGPLELIHPATASSIQYYIHTWVLCHVSICPPRPHQQSPSCPVSQRWK